MDIKRSNITATSSPASSSESYYNSDDGFRYYSLVNSVDYSGMGIWDETVECVDPINGYKYKRGNGRSVRDATMVRDDKMLKLIKDHMPNKKVKVLELGSGRGGLSRFIAQQLLKEDKLEQLVAANISEEENKYNRQRARELDIPEDKFSVEYASFDDMTYDTACFDVIFSNEAILHSSDKTKLMQEIARMLTKDGICVISDIIESPDADKEKLADVYARLDLNSMGNHVLYEKVLTEAGMTKLVNEVSSTPIINHYGMILYSATEIKREELLGPKGVSKDFLDK